MAKSAHEVGEEGGVHSADWTGQHLLVVQYRMLRYVR